MQDLIFIQLSISEVQQIFRSELEKFFAEQSLKQSTEVDKIGGVDLAVEITGKAKSTIYFWVHKRLIPHSKRGKQLYFSRNELTKWLKSGKRKTQAEVALDAENFSPTNYK